MSAEELAALSHSELVQLVLRLQAELAALRGALAAPPKTPANSSLPPSTAFKADRAARRRAAKADGEPAPKRGPKYGHPGVSRSRVPAAQVGQVLVCRPEQCGACGTALPATGGKVVGRQQVVDLPPITPVVVALQRLRVRCRHCGHGTVGSAPEGWAAQASFGPQVVALAALLHEQHHLAYERLVTVFAEVFGLTISEGALVAAVARLGTKLAPTAAAIADEVRATAVVGSDETSMRVDGATWWAWVFQTATAAVFRISPRRNADVLLTFLAGAQPGTWVSDLYGAQLAAPTERYQICQQQQLRALRYAEQWERGDLRQAEREWAQQFAALIRRAIHRRNQQPDDAFADPAFVADVAAIEAAGDALLREDLRVGESRCLQTRFLLHRAGLWTFLQDPAVPPTNNASEQALRPLVVHRKVTNGFRAEAAATRYAVLRTVAETARRRGQRAYAALLRAAGSPLPRSAPAALA